MATLKISLFHFYSKVWVNLVTFLSKSKFSHSFVSSCILEMKFSFWCFFIFVLKYFFSIMHQISFFTIEKRLASETSVEKKDELKYLQVDLFPYDCMNNSIDPATTLLKCVNPSSYENLFFYWKMSSPEQHFLNILADHTHTTEKFRDNIFCNT